MTNSEKAKLIYERGYNCCQSVLSTYGPEYKLDTDNCLRLASGFAAGMAYQGKTCGAVIGAYLVIGLLKGSSIPNDEYSKETVYRTISDFNSEFTKINQSLECRELLKKDVSQADDLDFIIRHKLFEINCPKYVEDAGRILDKLLNKYKNGE